MGTSPGAVYETLLNLCRGSYDCGGGECPRLSIDQVTLVRTSEASVEAAARVARLLIHCSGEVFPEGDERRLPCSVRSVGVVALGFPDIRARSEYEEFRRRIASVVGQGDVVDVSGGRVAMSVGAALAPLVHRLREVVVVATSVPQNTYSATKAAMDSIKANYDIERIEQEVVEQGCRVLQGYPGLVELLRRLVTGEATTILLYP